MWIRTGKDPWQLLLFSVTLYSTYACIRYNPNQLYIPSNRQERIYSQLTKVENSETQYSEFTVDQSNIKVQNFVKSEVNSEANVLRRNYTTPNVQIFRIKRQAQSLAESGAGGEDVVANSVSKNDGDAVAKAGNYHENGNALARSFSKGSGQSKARAHTTNNGDATAMAKAKQSNSSSAALARGTGNAYAASQSEGKGNAVASSLTLGNGSSQAEAISEDGAALATAVRRGEHTVEHETYNNSSGKAKRREDIFDDPFFGDDPKGKLERTKNEFDDEFFDQQSLQHDNHSDNSIVTSKTFVETPTTENIATSTDDEPPPRPVIGGRTMGGGPEIEESEEESTTQVISTTELSNKFNLLKLHNKQIKPEHKDFVFIGIEDEPPSTTTEIAFTTEADIPPQPIKIGGRTMGGGPPESEEETTTEIASTTEADTPSQPFKMGGRTMGGGPPESGEEEESTTEILTTSTPPQTTRPPNGNAISSSLTHKDGNAIAHAHNPQEGGNAYAKAFAAGTGSSNALADVGDGGNATALSKSIENNSTSKAVSGDDGTAIAMSMSEGAGNSTASSFALGNGISHAESTVDNGTAVSKAVFGVPQKVHETPFDKDVSETPSSTTPITILSTSGQPEQGQILQSTTTTKTIEIGTTTETFEGSTEKTSEPKTERPETTTPVTSKKDLDKVVKLVEIKTTLIGITTAARSRQNLPQNGDALATSIAHENGDAIAHAYNPQEGGNAVARALASGTGFSNATADVGDGGNATALAKSKENNSTSHATSGDDGTALATSMSEGAGNSVASSHAMGNGTSQAEATVDEGTAIATAVFSGPQKIHEGPFDDDDVFAEPPSSIIPTATLPMSEKPKPQALDKILQLVEIITKLVEFTTAAKSKQNLPPSGDAIASSLTHKDGNAITHAHNPQDGGNAFARAFATGTGFSNALADVGDGGNATSLSKSIENNSTSKAVSGDDGTALAMSQSEGAGNSVSSSYTLGNGTSYAEATGDNGDAVATAVFGESQKIHEGPFENDVVSRPPPSTTPTTFISTSEQPTSTVQDQISQSTSTTQTIEIGTTTEKSTPSTGVPSTVTPTSKPDLPPNLDKILKLVEIKTKLMGITTAAKSKQNISPNGNAVASSLTHKEGNAIAHAHNPQDGGNAFARAFATGTGSSNALADVGDGGNATAVSKSKDNNSTSHAVSGDDGTSIAKSLSEGAGNSVATSHSTGNGTSFAEATGDSGNAVATAIFGVPQNIHKGPFNDVSTPPPSTSPTNFISTSEKPKPLDKVLKLVEIRTKLVQIANAAKSKKDLPLNGDALASSLTHNDGNAIAHATNPNEGGFALARSKALGTGISNATAETADGGNATALAKAQESNSTAQAISGTDGVAISKSISEGSGSVSSYSYSKNNGTSMAEATANEGDAVASAIFGTEYEVSGDDPFFTEDDFFTDLSDLAIASEKPSENPENDPEMLSGLSNKFNLLKLQNKQLKPEHKDFVFIGLEDEDKETGSTASKKDLPPNGNAAASALTHKEGNAIAYANNPNNGGIVVARTLALGTGNSNATAESGDGGNATALAKAQVKNSTAHAISGTDGISVSRSVSEGTGDAVAVSLAKGNATSIAEATADKGDAIAKAFIRKFIQGVHQKISKSSGNSNADAFDRDPFFGGTLPTTIPTTPTTTITTTTPTNTIQSTTTPITELPSTVKVPVPETPPPKSHAETFDSDSFFGGPLATTPTPILFTTKLPTKLEEQVPHKHVPAFVRNFIEGVRQKLAKSFSSSHANTFDKDPFFGGQLPTITTPTTTTTELPSTSEEPEPQKRIKIGGRTMGGGPPESEEEDISSTTESTVATGKTTPKEPLFLAFSGAGLDIEYETTPKSTNNEIRSTTESTVTTGKTTPKEPLFLAFSGAGLDIEYETTPKSTNPEIHSTSEPSVTTRKTNPKEPLFLAFSGAGLDIEYETTPKSTNAEIRSTTESTVTTGKTTPKEPLFLAFSGAGLDIEYEPTPKSTNGEISPTTESTVTTGKTTPKEPLFLAFSGAGLDIEYEPTPKSTNPEIHSTTESSSRIFNLFKRRKSSQKDDENLVFLTLEDEPKTSTTTSEISTTTEELETDRKPFKMGGRTMGGGPPEIDEEDISSTTESTVTTRTTTKKEPLFLAFSGAGLDIEYETTPKSTNAGIRSTTEEGQVDGFNYIKLNNHKLEKLGPSQIVIALKDDSSSEEVGKKNHIYDTTPSATTTKHVHPGDVHVHSMDKYFIFLHQHMFSAMGLNNFSSVESRESIFSDEADTIDEPAAPVDLAKSNESEEPAKQVKLTESDEAKDSES